MQYSNNSGQTNPNWSFTFTGMDQIQTASTNVIPSEGYYEATLVSNVASTEREGTVEFTCRIEGGEFNGAEVTKGIKLPSHANNGFVWKGLFQSLGYDDPTINAPQFNPNPSDWNDQKVTIYWRPGSKELSVYRELRFYGAAEFNRKKTRFEAQQGVINAPATAAPKAVTPAPSIPSVPNAGQGLQGNMSGNALLSRLRNN
jgi:hypothetical protein